MEVPEGQRRRTRQPAAVAPPPPEPPPSPYDREPPPGAEAPADNEFDYDRDLEINPNFLDAEFLGHSRLAMKYIKESARANREAMLAEERVKTKRAELIKETMGTEWAKNAATQEAYYRTDADYQQLKADWIDACHYADLMKGTVSQFNARKAAIEGEIKLYGQGYFSTPQEPRELPEAAARLQEAKDRATQQVIRQRLTRPRG